MTITPAAVLAVDVILNPSRGHSDRFGRFGKTLADVRVRRAHRRAYEHLLLSEDRLLEDIGVSRAEVLKALHECNRG